jgi:hypothetical protein
VIIALFVAEFVIGNSARNGFLLLGDLSKYCGSTRCQQTPVQIAAPSSPFRRLPALEGDASCCEKLLHVWPLGTLLLFAPLPPASHQTKLDRSFRVVTLPPPSTSFRRTNDPNAGIDGRINWPEGTKHDVLAPGENVVQYKSGELTPRQLVKEFDKLGRGRNGHRRPARFSTPQHCREQDCSASDLSMHRKIIA